jgi:Fur family transcriptional regulator, ferric uptake regulator
VTQDTPAGTLAAMRQDAIGDTLARLRQDGMRSTPARRLLLGALHAQPGHRTAEELAAAVQAARPDLALSTIYRNLDELERLLVIDRTCSGHGPATYHLALAAHGHLVCDGCGTMTEIPPDMFAELTRAAQARYGFTIQPHRFAVTGLCADCQ